MREFLLFIYFLFIENIGECLAALIKKVCIMVFRFQKACVKYGVPDVDLFQAVDLMERKNIAQVTNTIFAIGRTVIN